MTPPSGKLGEALSAGDSVTRELQIREFRLTDYDSVLELWLEAGLVFRPGDRKSEIAEKIKRDPELFLVAEERGKIVGAVMGAWDGRRGWIYHLAVAPKGQRRGVGTVLVRELERRMSRKGVAKVNAVVYRDNQKSIGFFKKLGYQLDERSLLFGKLLRDKDQAG